MRKENRRTTTTPGDPLKKCESLVTRRRFDRLLPARGQRGDIREAKLEFQSVLFRETLDEACVRFPGPSPQSVLEMADDQLAITLGEQTVEQAQRSRARPRRRPGNGDR